jgi:hypothetical protein
MPSAPVMAMTLEALRSRTPPIVIDVRHDSRGRGAISFSSCREGDRPMRLCDVISTQGDGDSADDKPRVEMGATPSPTQLFLADASSTEESSQEMLLYSLSRPGERKGGCR